MANAKEVSVMLADRADTVAMYLLPNGRKQSKEWCVAGVDGAKGDSMRVCISGNKAGVWCDFATGATGDLLELWKEVRGLSFTEALNEAKQFLGVKDPEFVAPKKTFKRPEKPQVSKPKGDLLNYLTGTRQIQAEIVEKYKVGINDKGEFLFPILRDGELLNVKYLTPRKAEGQKNQWRQEAEAEPCLFGWQAIGADVRSIVITEGEIDCLSVASIGGHALSIPAGANNLDWLEYDYPNLDQFDDIVLMFDMDDAGQKNVQQVAQRLGLERVRVASLPVKDANEMLCSGKGFDLGVAIKSAKYLDPAELKAARTYQDELIDFFEGNLTEEKGAKLPWETTGDKVKQRPAELSIWTGINGHGKSQLLGYNAIGLIEQGERVCIFSGEMKPRRTLERMVRQIVATGSPTPKAVKQAFDFLDNRLWLFNVTGNAKAGRMLEVFAYARKRYGVTHFVIDSLMKCGFAEDDYNGQKVFVDKLCDFKEEHNVHIHLVAHPRKGESEHSMAGKMDVRGSGSITDLADNVFSVWRNKKKEDELTKDLTDDERNKVESKPDAVLVCSKQRNGDWEGKIALWFNPVSLQYYETSRKVIRSWI